MNEDMIEAEVFISSDLLSQILTTDAKFKNQISLSQDIIVKKIGLDDGVLHLEVQIVQQPLN